MVRLRPPILLLLMTALVGCEHSDERLVVLSERANERQAEQNRQSALQNQQVAETTNRLVQADAQARQDAAAIQREHQQEVRASRTRLDQQRDALEAERRRIADQRYRDPIIADAIGGGALLIAAVLPLVICILLLRQLSSTPPDEALGELLLAELVADEPTLLPARTVARLARQVPPSVQLPPSAAAGVAR